MKSYKTELDLNNEQASSCRRFAGAARWAYNYGIHRDIETHAKKEKRPTAFDLCKEIVILKDTPKEEGGCPWMREISKSVAEHAVKNLDFAYKMFFGRCKKKAERKGFPKLKSRRKGLGSFTLAGVIHVTESAIQLPRLGVFRLKEHGYFPTNVRVKKATVSERAGRWFVSILTDESVPVLTTGTEILGCDVGITTLATLSDGTTFENPKALKKTQRKLKHLQRALARKKKGSSNRKKAVQKLAQQHYKVTCVRKDAISKATSAIAKRSLVLGIESLNVSGMMKNHCLAGALGDASMSEFLRQLEYKMKWHGGTIKKADRFFPSSKRCSSCGYIMPELPLNVREWVCPQCGAHHFRDVNAAINLRDEAIRLIAVSSTVECACGGDVRPVLASPELAAPVKQEPDSIAALVAEWVSSGERSPIDGSTPINSL